MPGFTGVAHRTPAFGSLASFGHADLPGAKSCEPGTF